MRRLNVMLVTSNLLVQTMVCRALAYDPVAAITAVSGRGSDVLPLVLRHRPDVILLDLESDDRPALEIVNDIMIAAPTPMVTLTSDPKAYDRLKFRAGLEGGLVGEFSLSDTDAKQFEASAAKVSALIRAVADVKVVRQWRSWGKKRPPTITPAESESVPGVIAVASSTGGPTALKQMLEGFSGSYPLPIMVVQHLTPGSVTEIAEWLGQSLSVSAIVGAHGQAIEQGKLYLAPDGYNMGLSQDGRIALSPGELRYARQPSASHLFRSVADTFGPRSISVVLTGMGRDGVSGLREAKRAGGYVIAQDKSTSVVYGMPKAAVDAGVTDVTLPVGDIASAIRARITAVNL